MVGNRDFTLNSWESTGEEVLLVPPDPLSVVFLSNDGANFKWTTIFGGSFDFVVLPNLNWPNAHTILIFPDPEGDNNSVFHFVMLSKSGTKGTQQ